MNTPTNIFQPEIQTLLDDMKKNWPSPIVSREQIGKFTGGMLHRRTVANLDSKGQGPPRVIFGERTVAYPVGPLLEWLGNRMSTGKRDPLQKARAARKSAKTVRKPEIETEDMSFLE